MGISNVAAATFDVQRAAMAGAVAAQPEAAIMALLQAGLAEGKAVPAIAEARQWLAQNRPGDALLLYHAGVAAERSGDWRGAASLYQQYLADADLKSDTADEAVYATYVLLLERLGDVSSAYAFSRNAGNRLMVVPRARQFDQWFLDEAVRRNDVVAVAQRLLACIEGGLPNDLLVARYDQYFRWLFNRVSTFVKRDAITMNAELSTAFKRLTRAMTFFEEMKLRLDWAAAVLAYNQARLADKDVAPPIEEAKSLLTKYPRYALWVQTGWAGGSSDIHPHLVGDVSKYWPHQIEAKMAPIVEAAGKLDPVQLKQLLESWHPGYYRRQRQEPSLLQVKPVQDFLAANPSLMNNRMGVVLLDKSWNQLSPQETLALAPRVANSADPVASLIRAVGAGLVSKEVEDGDETKTVFEKDYDKMMAALLGPEVWRLGARELGGGYADGLWQYCGKPGGNEKRDAMIAKSKAVATKAFSGDVKQDAPAGQRIAAFRKLWADYRSPQPGIPAVYERLKAVLQFTPELVPELLQDASPEVQMLLRDAVASGMSNADGLLERDEGAKGLNPNQYAPWIQRLADRRTRGDLAQLKERHPELYAPHPLEQDFSKAIVAGLKQGKLTDWQVLAWINLQHPDQDEKQVKLMQALLASSVWQLLSFEVRFAAREWFNTVAMTPGQTAWVEAADPARASKALRELPEAADVATTVAALRGAIAGVNASPVQMDVRGLNSLAGLTNTVFTNSMVIDLVLEMTADLRVSCDRASEPFGLRLLSYVTATRDPVEIQRTAAFLWSIGISQHYARSLASTLNLAQSLLDDQPASASALARVGVASFARGYRGNPAHWWNANESALKALDLKASMKLGLMQIPVARTDPAYPVYESQMEWIGGNEESAWQLCQEHWDQLLPIHRELSIDYLMWVLERTIYSRDEVRQEALITALQTWAGEANATISLDRQVEIDLAYGDIAVQRGMLREAREIFARTAQNPAYAESTLRYAATLRLVRVARLVKNFDSALQLLEELELERDPALWSPVRYARAQVYFDMEEYSEALRHVREILTRESEHADAIIMQGALHIRLQNLMSATELEVGTTRSQATIVPGEPLKITLQDPTLEVSGAGTELEVEVWTTSGDRETILLRPMGNERTRFRGEVQTALGAANPGDRILQVKGDDEIYYDYSERFRRVMNDMEERRGGPITVVSDGLLMASSRVLLTADEQRLVDMQAQMESITEGEARSRMAAEAGVQLRSGIDGDAEAQAVSVGTLVKPGNPIYVRVVDPDRSRTARPDHAVVQVSSSSGDSISRVVLTETGPHTGTFEAAVPTAPAQAMAFAQHSEPGRNPNMVISPTTDYPAWRPEPGQARYDFTIDLNDNVELGALTITASEPGAKLQYFVVQTGMRPDQMTTIGVYPLQQDQITLEKPWHPSVTIMNDTDHHHNRNERSVYDLRELEEHLERGWMVQQYAQGVATNVAGPSVAMTNVIPGQVRWMRRNRQGTSHVIYRFRGYFHEPEAVTRRFKVELGKYEIPENTHPTLAHPAQFMLAVNGRPITSPDQPDKLEGEVTLKPGVHRFEIWATGWNTSMGFGRSVTVLANLSQDEIHRLSTEAPGSEHVSTAAPVADGFVPCPDNFFDPDRFPLGVLPHRNGKATITAREDGTAFNVTFTPGSQTRLVTVGLLRQEGPVPVINRVTLDAADGSAVLPVKEDFAALNQNAILEVLPDDRITVRYVDDRFMRQQTHERFLDVRYSDARLEFQFFEVRKDRGGNDQPYYERQLRFVHGEPVLLTISDADMNVSPELDTVTVTVEASDGAKKVFTAIEDKHVPGTFRVWIKPVKGAAAAVDEIQVGEGGTLTAIYRDAENISPGVPTDRFASIRHAQFERPVLSMSHADVAPIDVEAVTPLPQPLIPGFERLDRRGTGEDAPLGLAGREYKPVTAASGSVLPRWHIANTMRDAGSPPENGFAAVHGQMMYFEVEAPHLALRMGSATDVFVQTAAGRAAAREAAAQAAAPFDITVPGTMQLKARLVIPAGVWRETPRIPIYTGGTRPVRSDSRRRGEQNTAVFLCDVPLVAGILPDYGVMDISAAEQRALGIRAPHGLIVRPGDTVYVGFRYTDKGGAEQWLTGEARVTTHAVLDVLEEDRRTPRDAAFVGERLQIRVVDLGGDVSDQSDTVMVQMQARSGARHLVALQEVDVRSGVFEGGVDLVYATPEDRPADYNAGREGFPVAYGDALAVRYTDGSGVHTAPHLIRLQRGADGRVYPFSKTYTDPEMAVQLQFSLAEAWMEMAKHHRARGQEDLAMREFEQARQLLASVGSQFRDPETRAHIEYLLGNLAQEEADASESGELQQERYRAALARFMTVTGAYPDTLHAAMSQFKIATIYEKLEEPDIAAQEYVKLAYKYPESEFLGLAMARLGAHFLRKASAYEAEAQALAAAADPAGQFDAEAIQKLAVREYLNSAGIFSRLLERFPSHAFAGPGGLRAGQAYMRAQATRQAVNVFLRVIANTSYDGPDVRAQAMYWAGMCYETLGERMAAYSMYQRLTFDFPESRWAAFARGQLSQEAMMRFDRQQEIRQLQEGL